MSILSELGHLAMPINFLPKGRIRLAQAILEPETSRSRVLHSAAAPHCGVYKLSTKSALWDGMLEARNQNCL